MQNAKPSVDEENKKKSMVVFLTVFQSGKSKWSVLLSQSIGKIIAIWRQ